MRCGGLAGSLLGAALVVTDAYGGGFSRGTADTDILFEPGDFNLRAGTSVVVPSQKFSAGTDPALIGTNYLGTYVIPSAAVKFAIGENLACAGTYIEPFGAKSEYESAFGLAGKVSEDLRLSEFGATCAVFFDAGPGRFAVLGGAFVEQVHYDLDALPVPMGGLPLNVSLEGRDEGWRAGLAYEIPEIAFRAQLLYRSGTSYGAAGTASSPAFMIPGNTLPAIGMGELPQSVELKVQSGIAPGWLAFGSVKWMDWSVNETLTVSVPLAGIDTPNEYYWRDGWTVTAGIGHAFNEQVSGAISLQWDRGVSTGFDFRTDKWLLAGGANIKDARGGELRLGAGLGYMTSADVTKGQNAGISVDAGWAGILSATYSITW